MWGGGSLFGMKNDEDGDMLWELANQQSVGPEDSCKDFSAQ